ncbi:hypothetical protein EYV94_21615 [Puteibacter caeruleilacunae]|nr:hypothetical protein EYV94_21615 [Puteibacter caeruleilacunae]
MKRTTLMTLALMLMSVMTFAQYNENGDFSVSGNLGVGIEEPGYGLEVNKATVRFSNFYPVFRWRWGGSTDRNWKKIAEISMPDLTWRCASMEVIIFDPYSNYGNSVDGHTYKFHLSAQRSRDVNNNLDHGLVSGPVSDYVRLVKVVTGQYEVHVRQVDNWRYMEVTARQTGGAEAFTYVENPVDATSTGEVYMPQPIHSDYFCNGKFSGNVGIKTNPSSEYVLSANGTIRAREIKVDATDWADFVFDENYQLMPIEEVAQFIEENGHLPEIPDAKTVKKQGVSVGDMNTKLLQKIEELTLYMIEQKRTNDAQAEELKALKKQNEKLQSQINKLNQ